ncbi:hypothetical protein T265_09784 [Opisthorchis viverrini]|uniref:Uncharacterized protein n=1 Tax=Opisthorchis viverrini TaxID=6198 RepID=A0A074Z8W6_OPIVI|nr:hypothetical protein T265_09784 [Opisthorchis viverrini]KER22032.1 hypothetical protein T265_09784 [Opisthorchis viverrini]
MQSIDNKTNKLISCSTLSVPNCHATTRRKHEGWETARLSEPRQGKSRGRGRVRTTNLPDRTNKLISCSTLSVPNCHATTRRKHEGWETARLSEPRQGKSRGRGRVRTTDLPDDNITKYLLCGMDIELGLNMANVHIFRAESFESNKVNNNQCKRKPSFTASMEIHKYQEGQLPEINH